MDKFQAMNTFVAVVEAGSFVGAMDTVALSKPVVSRHVAELEEYLGVRLLQRTTRRLSLTDEGQNYYLRCKELLASVKEAESEITACSAEVHGRLRVGAPQTFGVKYLAPLWGKFVEENPQVKLDIILSDRVVDLVEEGYDVVIRIAQLPNSMLVCRPLAKTRMVLCASPGYLEQHGTPQHPQALRDHRVISYSYWAPGNEWHFYPNDGSDAIAVKTQPHIHANNGDTCRYAALAHQGIILQPDFLVGEDLRAGTLVELLPDYTTLVLNIYAVYPTRKLLPLKVRRFIDFLAEQLRTPPWYGCTAKAENTL